MSRVSKCFLAVQATHGQGVEEGANGEVRSGRADAAANAWTSRNRDS